MVAVNIFLNVNGLLLYLTALNDDSNITQQQQQKQKLITVFKI